MLHFLFASSSKHLQISLKQCLARSLRCYLNCNCNTLATRTKAHAPGGRGEEGYSTSSSQILSRGFFLFPDRRRRRRTNSAEYSSITEKKLCMELAKYSTLPVSLSCFHSGTVCSCRLRPYSAIDAKELAGLVVASLFSVAALTNTSA